MYIPREDYEKLWQLYGDRVVEGHYKICRTTFNKNYHHRVIQIVDINTTFIHSRSKNESIEHGVYIDVIPIDACPDRKILRLEQFINAVLFSVFNMQQKPEYNGGRMTPLICFATDMLLALVPNPERRYKIWTKAEKRIFKYDWNKCACLKCTTSQFHELVTAFPKKWFGDRLVPFEDIMAVVPSNAEEYCKAMYGDYMKLPPLEKRAVRHHTEFIDLNTPYSKYNGIYYNN